MDISPNHPAAIALKKAVEKHKGLVEAGRYKEYAWQVEVIASPRMAAAAASVRTISNNN